jgi:predicted Zn-dependent protease with MMP-like domain
VIDVPTERFEELVADALDDIPDELGRLMDNVAVFVREGSPGSSLLGRYDGIPLTARDRGYEGMVLPDRITIFRQPILARCRTEAEVVEQVRITVVHEVGHHFGIDDDRLHELGWA